MPLEFLTSTQGDFHINTDFQPEVEIGIKFLYNFRNVMVI